MKVEGDLCEKARFRKHADKLVLHEVDGASVGDFGVADAASVGIPLGDREHFVRGIRLLYRLYQQASRHRHELKVQVLSAQHLPTLDIIGSIDAYVMLRLDDKLTGTSQEHCTTVVEDSRNPTWANDEHIFKIRDLADPGELTILLFDNDLLTHDDLCGAHLLGEVFKSLPALNPRSIQREMVFLKDIISSCKASKDGVEMIFSLYHAGEPVFGEDGMQAEVRLHFQLLHEGRQVHNIQTKCEHYPRQHPNAHPNLRIIAECPDGDQTAEVDAHDRSL